MIITSKLTAIRTKHYTGKVYNLELKSNTSSTEKEDQYFIDASSKLISHNCFPKDLSALMTYAKSKDVQTPLLRAVWDRNTIVDRPQRDWEKMKGRAVSN